MAWTTSNIAQSAFASLGNRYGDTYTVGEDCLAVLEEILRKLSLEDCTLRTFRRAIGFGQNIRKDLIPLLLHVKNDTKIPDAAKIIDTTIKILVNLTIPVEYLLPVETMSRTDIGRRTIFEVNRLLSSSKEAFVDSRSTRAVVDHMKYIVENDSQFNLDQCDSINNCLLLLRNILHIPETKVAVSTSPVIHSGMQNQILWNLFTQSIDKIIIYLMSCSQKMYWSVTIVQLIALMYKDQHVGTLQKLLNLWLEASLTDSSEDNESNTSPPGHGSGESSPMITSDPTSDSSDNYSSHRITNSSKSNSTSEVVRAAQNRSKALAEIQRVMSIETNASSGISSLGECSESSKSLLGNETSDQDQVPSIASTNGAGKKRECPSSQSEISDCGYVTQVENQESISTSSNDDDHHHEKPVHQKPHTKIRYNSGKNRATTALEKKELRRKKLVKRSKTNTIKMKGLMHHLPTDEDIANILKEFTVDFLLKGYGTLVQELHSQLLTNIHLQIDTSHFFWLVTYFLKFATQLELDPEHISPVLSYEIFSYLIFQGIWVYEELEISQRSPDVDLKPCLRRLHLVVTAIREFLQGVESYQHMIHLSDDDRSNLQKLQTQISNTEDLRSLFILLLREYNPVIQSKQYLQDLILTNHNFLLFLDNTSKSMDQEFDIIEHLKQYASVEIMGQYGLLLESFKENGEFVNNCIFTMMHHIGGDLKNVPLLFQPSILKTFSQIWETDYEICDDWSDLIEYVIHKFINTSRNSKCDDEISKELEQGSLADVALQVCEWTKEEKGHLLNYYNQSIDAHDTISDITKKFHETGMHDKTRESVIKELLVQKIINKEQYNDFMKIKYKESSPDRLAEDNIIALNAEENLVDGDIKLLKEYLIKENKGKMLFWLQKLLIETCYVKIILAKPEQLRPNTIVEPTIYYYALLNLPVPVVPWTSEQSNILKHQPFIILLHKLGFYLPVDTGKFFVRIPNFWNADYIFSIAQQLVPIDPGKLKFDVNMVNGCCNNEYSKIKNSNPTSLLEHGKFSVYDLRQTPFVVRYTPLPNSSEWFQNIVHSKIATIMDPDLQISSNQLSITIPETLPMSSHLPPPELSIVDNSAAQELPLNGLDPVSELESIGLLSDEIDRNSESETTSVASDLTRMCVSDEEDKVIGDK